MDGYKRCPDCAAEGLTDPQPADAFYHVKSPRNATGYRLSAYCKRHTKARNAKSARDAPAGSGIRASRERARAAWRTRNPERWKAIMRGVMRRRKATDPATADVIIAATATARLLTETARARAFLDDDDKPEPPPLPPHGGGSPFPVLFDWEAM